MIFAYLIAWAIYDLIAVALVGMKGTISSIVAKWGGNHPNLALAFPFATGVLTVHFFGGDDGDTPPSRLIHFTVFFVLGMLSIHMLQKRFPGSGW